MYSNACMLQTAKTKNSFANLEEHYDYAVSLLNDGNYEDAREHFTLILKQNDKADYAFYGLGGAGEYDRGFATLPGASDGGNPAESPEQDPGEVGLGFSGYGGRSAIYRPTVSGGLTLSCIQAENRLI